MSWNSLEIDEIRACEQDLPHLGPGDDRVHHAGIVLGGLVEEVREAAAEEVGVLAGARGDLQHMQRSLCRHLGANPRHDLAENLGDDGLVLLGGIQTQHGDCSVEGSADSDRAKERKVERKMEA